MGKKKNTLSRRDGHKRFYENVMKLRADIKSGVTTAETFKVEDYFNTKYGRYVLEPLLLSKIEPDRRACSLFMYLYNRFRNEQQKRKRKNVVIQQEIKFAELEPDTCISYLKSLGYKIMKPRPVEYDEI